MGTERIRGKLRNWHGAIAVSLGVSVLLLTVRYLGAFQKEELAWLDRFFRWRTGEPTDERIVIVGLNEGDIEKYPPYPFTDATLAKLLNRLKRQQPKVIALDLIRNVPTPPGTEALTQVFETTPNLIGVGKLTQVSGDRFFAPIPFPPVLEARGQIADISAIEDEDGVTRRAFLYPLTDGSEPSKIPSLGLAAAYEYLLGKGIEPSSSEDGGWLKLGGVTFSPFRSHDGGYIRADDVSYQVLLNWRGPSQSFRHVSVTEVMEGKIPADLFRDRIVFIGAYAPSLKDDFDTPYSREQGATPKETYGVELQAHLTSQILSSALDGSPLLKVWPEPVEILWICLWALLPACLGWLRRSTERYGKLTLTILGSSLIITGVLIGGSYFIFLQSWWIPVLFPLLSLWGGTLGILSYVYLYKLQKSNFLLQEANTTLEDKVELRTQQLNQKNQELERALQELKRALQTVIAQEKLASLGTLVAGMAHEIRNPVHLIQWNAQLAAQEVQNLQQRWEENRVFLEDLVPELLEETKNILAKISQKMTRIEGQSGRSDLIIQRILSYVRRDRCEPTWIDLNQLVRESWNLVEQEKEKSERVNFPRVNTDFDLEIAEIQGIETDLRRALINLIENAWDAVEEKGTKEGKKFTPMIALATRNLGKLVEIRISDNGGGMSPEIRSQIFTPFFTKKASGKGTGLGLFFVQEIIVGEHQGEIQVETEVGQGSEFIIVLPQKWGGTA